MAQPPVPPSASAQDAGRGMAPKPAAPDTGPGGTFQDCPTCPVMARVPAGGFMMGQGAKDPAALPAHHVTLRAFALGQSPVTVAEWRLCAAEGGCAPPPRMAVTEDSTPLHNVSWDDAQTYLTWLSRKAGQTYRLPSEAEWEYAARAGTTTRYWWSDQIGIGLANCGDCGGPQEARAPMPATAFQPNAFNLHGMGGGVAQWTADCWFPNYAGAPADGSARDGKACTKRVLRGGSFKSARDDITPVARNFYDAPVRYFTNGFRVARDLN